MSRGIDSPKYDGATYRRAPSTLICTCGFSCPEGRTNNMGTPEGSITMLRHLQAKHGYLPFASEHGAVVENDQPKCPECHGTGVREIRSSGDRETGFEREWDACDCGVAESGRRA